jgi:hypothetical protein
MFQIILETLRMLHRGRACCKTRSRNFGDRNPAVKTVTETPSNFRASFSTPASVKQGRSFRRADKQIKIAVVGVGASENRTKDARPQQNLRLKSCATRRGGL